MRNKQKRRNQRRNKVKENNKKRKKNKVIRLSLDSKSNVLKLPNKRSNDLLLFFFYLF